MIAIRIRARQFRLAELTALNLAGHHVRDTLSADALEVLTCLVVLVESE
jgi:hypothetical protein